MAGRPRNPNQAVGLPAAAAMLGYPVEWIKAAKHAGVPGFAANGRVPLKETKEWIEANKDKLSAPQNPSNLKEQKLAEEVRKLKIANDLKQSKLVEVSWVCERMAELGGRFNTIEAEVLKEAPQRQASAGDDIARHREILRGIIAEFRDAFSACADSFRVK